MHLLMLKKKIFILKKNLLKKSGVDGDPSIEHLLKTAVHSKPGSRSATSGHFTICAEIKYDLDRERAKDREIEWLESKPRSSLY